MASRNARGQFSKVKSAVKDRSVRLSVITNHTYYGQSIYEASGCSLEECSTDSHLKLLNTVNMNGWRVGLRMIECGVLLDKLAYCQKYRLVFIWHI